mmetsp:Transcript_108350/g.215179  ORF Transcript_108350/g.215179 Transcript_108350/m.215179 type:complete len:167 (+) Transcript_108350:196-696(+)
MHGAALQPNLVAINAAALALLSADRVSEAVALCRETMEESHDAKPQGTQWGHEVDLHRLPAGLAKLTALMAIHDAVLQPSGLHEDKHAAQLNNFGGAAGLVFITGRGLHSEGGEPVLRPVVLAWLREALQLPAYACAAGRVRVPLAALLELSPQQKDSLHGDDQFA